MTKKGDSAAHGLLPRHVAVIMDGNGRWAKQNNKPRLEGHREGAKSVREIITTASDAGIEYLTLYAFSVENWQRPKAEVFGLMTLLGETLKSEKDFLMGNDIRLRAIGRLSDLPAGVQKNLQDVIDATSQNTRMTLVLALSYSSRVEITEAVRKIAEKIRSASLAPSDITEQTISDHLYAPDIPDPDLLIRTSGEFRISNFLLWQISYAEIYTTAVMWPDFRKEQFLEAIHEYKQRHRRFGGI